MASPTDPTSQFLHESLGKKVSIRLRDEDGGFRDLLGELISLDTVRRKDGSAATFDRGKVFAFRIVEMPARSKDSR